MSVSNGFNVKLELLENYIFKVDFGEFGVSCDGAQNIIEIVCDTAR